MTAQVGQQVDRGIPWDWDEHQVTWDSTHNDSPRNSPKIVDFIRTGEMMAELKHGVFNHTGHRRQRSLCSHALFSQAGYKPVAQPPTRKNCTIVKHTLCTNGKCNQCNSADIFIMSNLLSGLKLDTGSWNTLCILSSHHSEEGIWPKNCSITFIYKACSFKWGTLEVLLSLGKWACVRLHNKISLTNWPSI